MRLLLSLLLSVLVSLMTASEIYHNPRVITVNPGESIHDAVRQAREWRRTNDPQCAAFGVESHLKAGRYYMQ